MVASGQEPTRSLCYYGMLNQRRNLNHVEAREHSTSPVCSSVYRVFCFSLGESSPVETSEGLALLRHV